MTALAKNYDVICFQLRSNLYSQLEHPLKTELNDLTNNIKSIITSGKKLQSQPAEILSEIFNLRIKALKWLATSSNYDYPKMLTSIVEQIEKLRSNKRLEILADNILFALRCNQKVIISLAGENDLISNINSSNVSKIPDITYSQFITSIAFANINNDVAQKIADFTNTSLHIEFVLAVVGIISEENLHVTDETINDLAFLVSDSAQEYYALAIELGIIKLSSAKNFQVLASDNDFIKEQKELADLGLKEFEESF